MDVYRHEIPKRDLELLFWIRVAKQACNDVRATDGLFFYWKTDWQLGLMN